MDGLAGWLDERNMQIIGGAILFLSFFVKVPKIEVNIWSILARHIGKAINGEVLTKVDELSSRMDNFEESTKSELQSIRNTEDEREIKQCRTRITRYGDEVLRGLKHSKNHADQILLDATTYENYCSSHPNFENDVTAETIENIKRDYRKRLATNDFLQGSTEYE